MTAPVITNRGTPAGKRITDGYQTTMAFAADADASFWEITVTPPGIDGGDPVENTTMLNTAWRTKAARQLKTLTDSKMTAAYDPQVYDNILALINVEGAISVHFADGSTLSFFGYLQKFELKECKEGDQPTADITVVPTNYDPVAGVEEPPVYSATGT